MEKELEQPRRSECASIADLERKNQQEEQSVLAALDMKRARLIHRWTLEEAILRKKFSCGMGYHTGHCLRSLSATSKLSASRFCEILDK